MKTIIELNKERLMIRKTNPSHATVINLLIDGVTKRAKKENRDIIVNRMEQEIHKEIKKPEVLGSDLTSKEAIELKKYIDARLSNIENRIVDNEGF
jgi:hypothetical protein